MANSTSVPEFDPMPVSSLDLTEWAASALVLVIEHRTCRACSRTYSAPVPHLMVRIHNPLKKLLRHRLIKRSVWLGDTRDLPREVDHAQEFCARCPGCFPGEPEGQLLLFPPQPKRLPTLSEVLAIKRLQQAEEQPEAQQSRPRSSRADAETKAALGRAKAAELFKDL